MFKKLCATLEGAFNVTVSAIWKIALLIALFIFGIVFMIVVIAAAFVHIAQ